MDYYSSYCINNKDITCDYFYGINIQSITNNITNDTNIISNINDIISNNDVSYYPYLQTCNLLMLYCIGYINFMIN